MKKYFGIFLAALLCMMLAVAASAADVYVNDGGTGDGSSADKPLGNMTEAINKIAADGGKVIIVDTYTCAEEYHEPEHAGDIVITGGNYVFTNGKYNRWFLSGSGSTTFENMTFSIGDGSTSMFVAQYNKLIMGEGLTTIAAGNVFVLGGYQYPLLDDTFSLERDSDVTVKSGNYYLIAGHSRGAGEVALTGTSHVTVEGGEIRAVYGSCINGKDSGAGNTVINIKGGNLQMVHTAGDGSRRINGDATVNITGGMIATLKLNNVMGKTTVNFSGGSVGLAEKTVADAVATFVVDGTATLNATPNVDAKMISLFFDKVNYVSEISGETPAQTTAPAETTAAPVETTAAPVETTAAPVVTTAAPVVTTAAPVVTTAAPVVTTAAPVVTTAAPVVTTAAPVVTTAAPVVTTAAPVETTAAPAETTAAPAETTAAPAVTTAAPTAPAEEGGAPVGLIVGIVAAVVVVAAVAVVVIKKKK